ncbi:MAG: hypothetical protein IJD14_02510 [Christensenellaceae bacterium]|nr:hypothetical protein [Christensenellaceae bacterium]
MKKRQRFFAAVMTMMLFAGMAGYISAKTSQTVPDAPEPEIRISSSTKVTAKILYKACSHSVTIEGDDFVGMNKEEFRENFKGRIKEFTEENVNALRTIYSYCPKHKMIKTDADGELKVMQADEDGVFYVISKTGVFAKDLTKQNKERADAGVMLSSLNTEEFVLDSLTND